MQRLGLGVADLAVLLDLSTSTIYHWLRGQAPHRLMRMAVLYTLDNTKDYRYNPKEIEAALRAYRQNHESVRRRSVSRSGSATPS